MTDDPKSILDRLKQHWFVSTLLICVAVATATWKFSLEVLVAPRDFQITQLREEIQRLKRSTDASPVAIKTAIAAETLAVTEGNAIATTDGRLSIRADNVSSTFATVSVTLDANEPQRFSNKELGSRLVVEGKDRTYFVDLLSMRGNIIDLSVSFKNK